MDDAQRALLEWIDNELTSVVQALDAMAERNDETAKTMEDLGVLTSSFRDSAKSWRAKAAKLTALYAALPEDEE